MKKISATIIFLLLIASFIGFFVEALNKVISGAGAETYTTGYGVQFNYFGATVVLAIAVIILCLWPISYWRKNREFDDLKKKYGQKEQDKKET